MFCHPCRQKDVSDVNFLPMQPDKERVHYADIKIKTFLDEVQNVQVAHHNRWSEHPLFIFQDHSQSKL